MGTIPGSVSIRLNLKPDALSCQFTANLEVASDASLPPSCILGAASWLVEEQREWGRPSNLLQTQVGSTELAVQSGGGAIRCAAVSSRF